MNATEPKLPEHEAIYQRVRDMILFGDLAPGQPVTILGLRDMMGAGMTPVREAIRRLTAEGALQALGNRRICVPDITLERLEEISFVRLAIEPRMVELAAQDMNARTLTMLKSIDDRVNAAIARGNVHGYLEHNFRFHFHLYDTARATILRKIALSLWLQVGPALRIVCGLYGTSTLPDKHDEAMAALRKGDGAAAAAAIADDIRQGMDLVSQSIRSLG